MNVMIAVAVTDTMKVTANVIKATTPVDNPELSDCVIIVPSLSGPSLSLSDPSLCDPVQM